MRGKCTKVKRDINWIWKSVLDREKRVLIDKENRERNGLIDWEDTMSDRWRVIENDGQRKCV